MKWLDRILRKNHASAAWQPEAGFRMRLDLDRHALCDCRIGDPIEWLSGLGPPEDTRALREERYCYHSKGFEVGAEDGKVTDFIVYWVDYLKQGFLPFHGPVTYSGKDVTLSAETREEDFTVCFDAPYWRDQDEDETILFYEFREDIEWQVEFTSQGFLKAVSVVRPPLMAEAEQRKLFGVSAAWPPD